MSWQLDPNNRGLCKQRVSSYSCLISIDSVLCAIPIVQIFIANPIVQIFIANGHWLRSSIEKLHSEYLLANTKSYTETFGPHACI